MIASLDQNVEDLLDSARKLQDSVSGSQIVIRKKDIAKVVSFLFFFIIINLGL
jgi:hypothetical protein